MVPSTNEVRTIAPRAGEGDCAQVIESEERIRESYADYLEDESRFGAASVDRLVFPRCEEQVATVLAEAQDAGTEVTVSAGRTGIVGGAVPNRGTLVSLVEMNRVRGISRRDDGRLVLRVEPGLSIAELADMLDRRELGLQPEELSPEERGALDAFTTDERGFFYPPDPTEDTAHIGATVATNASGARSFRYGATREHVQSMRVCLPGGDVLALERGACVADGRTFRIVRSGDVTEVTVPSYVMPATKNAAGYYAAEGMDLVDLFVGSEGTLGIVTEVGLLLTRRPGGTLSALAFFPSDGDAVAFVRHARGDLDAGVPDAISALAYEFFDSRSLAFLRSRKEEQGQSSSIPELPEGAAAGVLFEQEFEDEDDLMAAYEAWEEVLSAHGSSMEQTWGGMEEADLERLKALRHALPEEVNNTIARAKAEHPEIHKIGTDAAVPPGALEEVLEDYRDALDGTGLEHVVFGHIGDNHLHLNILPKDPGELAAAERLAVRFAAKAVELGGTVSAEHGIGKLKHAFLELLYGEQGLSEMAGTKLALDPDGLLNRDVMFPERLLTGSGT
ncbi:MAG: FAD-binding protein [Candidatus Eisenbacteria bacterium]|nr:FAD-binding protein [Candidatus Eisenbacteria bacterium]